MLTSFRFLSTLLFVLVLSLRLNAAESQPLIFYPDWFPGAQFAGVYVALDQGLYREAALDVSLVPFAFGQKTGALIAAKPEVCGVASFEGYIFLQKRARGEDWVTFTAMLQQGPAGFISLAEKPVSTGRDFTGKTIGVHKFADPLYRWFLRRAGLAPESATMVFVDDDLKRLTSGEVTAMQGFATEEFVRLQRLTGNRAHFLSFAELGFDSYSQLVATSSAQAKTHRESLRRFIAATRRGWEEAFAHPERAIAAVHARVGPTCDDDFQRAALAALRPYVMPGGAAPLPPMDSAKWKRLEQTCVDIGFITKPERVENFLVSLP